MRAVKFGVIVMMVLSLSGCVTALIGGGTETAVVVAQERSVGNAMDDAGILIKIKNAYANDPSYKDLLTHVEVKVVEGRVLLTGNVDKADSQIGAVKIAWQIQGVKEVMNEVVVNDQAGVWNYTRDVWISAQVKSRLLFEKKLQSINYSVVTVNQVVYLMGIAQNKAELDKATYLASTTSYVQRVTSYVRLKDDPRRGYPSN